LFDGGLMVSRYPMIAREGWLFIGITLALAAILAWFVGVLYAIPLTVLTIVLLYFYRDPPRKAPAFPLAVICPIDGFVTEVGDAEDPWLKRPARKIGISMSRSGIYSIRSPVEGKVQEQWSPDVVGGYYAMWVQTDEQDDVSWGIETRGPRGPECYVQPGERVGQGQRCGFFIPGTSVDLYLPMDARVDVQPGDKVFSGQTVVATLIHNEGATIIIDGSEQ
jgi:phosphatidylserine decarboxylase